MVRRRNNVTQPGAIATRVRGPGCGTRGAAFLRFGLATLSAALAPGLVLLPAAAVVAAQPDPTLRIDEATGRDILNYAPHRLVDFTHMRLEIDIPDMNAPRFKATSTLSFEPIAEPVSELPLDAHYLTIRSIQAQGHSVDWTHDDHELVVEFEPPVDVGERLELVIRYEAEDPPRGLVWTPESAAWPGRPAQIHTQGQPETNSYWFPCHDFPNERLTTELIVTVPPGYLVSANGRLVSREESRAGASGDAGTVRSRGRETFHWLQDEPHPNYLVSLVVGRFDVVDVAKARGMTGRTSVPLEMPVYVPPGRGPDVARTYGNTAEMVRVFERLFDEPYPWDRYAQLVVWNFMAGGMENTAATTMYGTALFDETAAMDFDLDGLIAHELAHQWYGDLITCRTWEHLWLNEGLATYGEALWFEHVDGELGYQREMVRNFDYLIGTDRANAPLQQPMVSKAYLDPDHVFDRESDVYSKGASVLHMLRQRLGDELFFRGLREYTDRFRQRSVETIDLRHTFEAVSGESLQRFFTQWCERPGIPVLDVSIDWDEGDKALRIDLEQTQNIDDWNPAFALELPVWIAERPNSGGRIVRIPIEQRSATAVVPARRDPAMVVIDPRMEVLSELRVRQPERRWLEMLRSAPTPAARVQAIRHLGESDGSEAASALFEMARDPGENEWFRREAIRTFESRTASTPGELNLLMALAADPPEDPHVRRQTVDSLAAAIDAIEDADEELVREAAGRFATLAEADVSYRVRAAAVEGLGTIGADSHVETILAGLETESQHDVIRQASLRALRILDLPIGLEQAIRFAQPGNLSRTRALAAEVVGDLAHHDEAAALAILEEVVSDRVERARIAAGEALAKLGTPAAAAVLEARAAVVRSDYERERLRRWAGEARRE